MFKWGLSCIILKLSRLTLRVSCSPQTEENMSEQRAMCPHPIDSFGASPLPWKEGVNLSQEDDRSYFSEPNPAFQSSALPPSKFFDSASPLSSPQPWEHFHKWYHSVNLQETVSPWLQQHSLAVTFREHWNLALWQLQRKGHLVFLFRTLHQGCTQVRFWIQFKIPTEYVRLMPRLPENVKIKIPQVGSLTNKS